MTAIGLAFLLLASVLLLVSAIGLYRLPDTLTRMAAGSLATGLTPLVIALSLSWQGAGPALVGWILAGALFISSPLAGHLLGRAVLIRGQIFRGTTLCLRSERMLSTNVERSLEPRD
jgi:monovalent cation/proton antiporter MnhG/PhaG subunit